MKNLVVITGGTRGLGLELAKKFIGGDDVLIIARNKVKPLPKAKYEFGDVTDEGFLKKVYQKYRKTHKISYLINNAATGAFGAPETNDKNKIDLVLGAGLVGTILNTTYAIPLLNQDGAKIVNILSTAAIKGNVNESLYCAQKWGARGYTESLKSTYKGTKIKVVSVCPGGMNTEFWRDNRDYVPEEKSNKWMDAAKVAELIYQNITNNNLCVSDIVIERV